MVDLRIERTVHGGVSLARLPGGRLALVTGAIPGELVRAELREESGVVRGHIEEILEASSDRLPPDPGGHPGLDFGHIRYPRQLAIKREIVEDALSRALGGSLLQVPEVRPAPAIWRYRGSVQPAVANSLLGYRRPGTAEVVPLQDDPVANPGIARAWTALSERRIPKGVREVVFKGNDEGDALIALIAVSPQRDLLPYAHELVRGGVASGVSYARFDARGRFRGGSERLAGSRTILQRYGRYSLSVSASSFAQPNPAAASRLYLEAVRLAGSGATAVELFAGSGALALHLADGFERVVAVDVDRASIARGRADAARLGVTRVDFLALDARRFRFPRPLDLVAVDPPRAGLAKEVRELIDESPAQRLLYVSCDPATWARDVTHFGRSGWRLDLVQPFDFYPHTHHVELLSLLIR